MDVSFDVVEREDEGVFCDSCERAGEEMGGKGGVGGALLPVEMRGVAVGVVALMRHILLVVRLFLYEVGIYD